MSTKAPLVAVALCLVGLACQGPVSPIDCRRLRQTYEACELTLSLDEPTCTQRFGHVGTSCAKSFETYTRCIESVSCTTLSHAQSTSVCKDQFIALDIDCDGASFSPE